MEGTVLSHPYTGNTKVTRVSSCYCCDDSRDLESPLYKQIANEIAKCSTTKAVVSNQLVSLLLVQWALYVSLTVFYSFILNFTGFRLQEWVTGRKRRKGMRTFLSEIKEMENDLEKRHDFTLTTRFLLGLRYKQFRLQIWTKNEADYSSQERINSTCMCDL